MKFLNMLRRLLKGGGNQTKQDARFYELMESHAPWVWANIIKRGVPAKDAEDVFQNICIAFADHVRRGNIQNPPALLSVLARNKINDYWKKHGGNARREAPLVGKDESSCVLPAPCSDMGSPMNFYQILEIAGLNEEMKNYLELRFILGLTYREIGEAYQISEKTIQSRIRKALNNIKKVLF